MENEEYVVIIFERKIYDAEREFILPICASVGYIKNEGNVEYFETLDGKSYEKLSEHNKENSNKYYGFPIKLDELKGVYEFRTKKRSNNSYNPLVSFYFKYVREKAYYQKYDEIKKYYVTYTIDEHNCVDVIDLDLDYFDAIYAQVYELEFPLKKDELDYELDEYVQSTRNENKEFIKKVSINKKLKGKTLDVKELFNKVSSNVIGQDDAIKKVICAIAKNRMIINSRMKENVLLYGPTGCGKTEIIRSISEYLDIPVEMVDANDYTIAGYYGKDIDDIIKSLYMKNNNDKEKTEQGIVFIDEIDKICTTDPKNIVSHIGVQQALLKLVEGKDVDITIGKDLSKRITINTSKMTFIFGCSFAFMKENSYTKKTMGFGNVNEKDKLYAEQLNSDNLIKYGLIPELVGRISSISEIKKLTKEDLKTIVLNSKLSQLKLYSEFLNSMGISLINDEKFIDAVVNEANKMNTGARSINNIVSHCFEEAMFEILSNFSDYNELILTEDTVKDNKQYILK